MPESRPARVRASLWQLVAHNLGLKLTALVVAVVVWGYVQGSQVVEVRTRARLEWKLPEGLVSVEPLRKSLVVTLQGSQGRARAVRRDALTITVDLEDAEAGPVAIDASELPLEGLPQGLEVVQLSPPAIDFTLEPPLTRQVHVKALVMGEPAEGYRRASVTAEPDTVEIIGPSSLVRGISEVPTDIVDISGATESRVTAVPLALKERTVSPVGERSVQVRIEIEAELATRVFQDVPVLARDAGWKVTPEAVQVALGGPVLEMGRIQGGSVSVVVGLPEGLDPDATRVAVHYTPGEDEGAVRITHPGSDDIDALSLDLTDFVLEKVD